MALLQDNPLPNDREVSTVDGGDQCRACNGRLDLAGIGVLESSFDNRDVRILYRRAWAGGEPASRNFVVGIG